MKKFFLKLIIISQAIFLLTACDKSYLYDSVSVTQTGPDTYTYDLKGIRLQSAGLPVPLGGGNPSFEKIGQCEFIYSRSCNGLRNDRSPCDTPYTGQIDKCIIQTVNSLNTAQPMDLTLNFSISASPNLKVGLYCNNNGTIPQGNNFISGEKNPPRKVLVAVYTIFSNNCARYPLPGRPPASGLTPQPPSSGGGGGGGGGGPVVAAPTAASNLLLTDDNGGMGLSWTDNSSDETSFVVMRSLSGAEAYVDIATLAANTTNYTDPNNLADTLYDYKIRAVNTGGSSTSTAATGQSNSPADASVLMAFAIGPQINLTWGDNNMFPNETGFSIERRDSPAGAWSEIATEIPDMTTYQDTTVVPSTAYDYRVKVYRGRFESMYSNVVTITSN